MKKFLKENWFKIIIGITILLIGFSFFYYFFLRPYQSDKPYRECVKRIDPNANFGDVQSRYANCMRLFK